MRSDPTTEEGKEEIRKIFEKRKQEAEEARKRSEEEVDSEPCGKLTTPREIDVRRDRKNNDESE